MYALQKTLGLGFLAIVIFTAADLTARGEASNELKTLGELKQSELKASQYCGVNNLHVDSRVNAYVKVYVNGVYRGTLAPFGDIFPFVGDLPSQATDLYAVTTDGRFTWRMTVFGNYGSYQWILYP
jgi:hypothetical protein